MPCEPDPAIQEALGIQDGDFNMMDFYDEFWKPFGELLTDMEKEGMLVDRCYSFTWLLLRVCEGP